MAADKNHQNGMDAINKITLPAWLDKLIFDKLDAVYCRSGKDMTVIDWDKSAIQNYLGTYFPRSYAESVCIFTDYFRHHAQRWENKEQISIFDFGSGTGGEIIGLLTALQRFKQLKQINIVAFDGNHHALRLFEQILDTYRPLVETEIKSDIIPITIDDFYDMDILTRILPSTFDIIMTFKAICEFVTKQQFEKANPYEHFARTFLPKLTPEGIMALIEISSCNCVSKEWLPVMLDKGLNATACRLLAQNEGYNQTFVVSHSHCPYDISKIAWRIIEKEHDK